MSGCTPNRDGRPASAAAIPGRTVCVGEGSGWVSMRLAATVRSKIMPVVLVALTLVTAAGCANADAHPQTTAASVPSPVRLPAETAGGACYLLDYDVIEQIVGTSFDVAAASEANDTFTCVLQQAKDASYPDLTLAVSATDADATTFKSTVQPKGAAPVTELGKIGYTVTLPPTADAGPTIEVGWLSGNSRILIVRYRFPATATPDDVGALTPKVVALAKKIDQTSL
jgi:hypothetical protein